MNFESFFEKMNFESREQGSTLEVGMAMGRVRSG
jgi:hypothetical protein